MPDRTYGPNIIAVDLIDDLHVDTVTFHDPRGVELHRAPVVARDPVVYLHDGPDGLPVQARAWTGDACVYEFTVITMFRGTTYTVSFDD